MTNTVTEATPRVMFNSFIDVATLDKNRPRTVVFYGRVSTEHEAQLSALENQMQWYNDEADRHQNWTVVDTYIDEGITGTQAKKRPAFLKMIEDAKQGRFDLIVTREVCRFARNVIDALEFTRMLRSIGVEVYFTNDNIWTFDGNDELKLGLMATFAQEESRKVSERVKAGQRISRENKTLYGNGNILGYDLDKENNTYIINPEQAETVRMIFEMYADGDGSYKIANTLTKLKRKTATGRVKWDCTLVLRILANATYMGCICYNKSRSNNFLEQKRVKNWDEETYVYEKGDFEPIVSEELWQRCYKIRKAKSVPSVVENGVAKKVSRRPAKDFWQTKLRCKCGSTFRKDLWHQKKNGEKSYGYSCYNRLNNGNAKKREQMGLDTEGFCGMPMICDWKLDMISEEIFKEVQIDKIGIAAQVLEYIREYYKPEAEKEDFVSREYLVEQREKLEKKRKNIMNMRAEGELSKEDYAEMKAAVEEELQRLDEQEQNLDSRKDLDNGLVAMLAKVEQTLKEYSENIGTEIEKEMQYRLISRITPESTDRFVWELSTGKDNVQTLHCNVKGRKNKAIVSIDEFQGGGDNPPLHKKSVISRILHRLHSSKVVNPKIVLVWDFTIPFEAAEKWRKAHGAHLRKSQWQDLTVKVCLEIG